MSAIAVHHTDTNDGAWDGPGNETKLKLDQNLAFYKRAYAWRDPEGDETKKSSYKFIHHFVDGDGNPGAASTRACSTGIAVLNGGRGGTNIPEADRRGVYNHLAAHIKDAGLEPPELKSLSFNDVGIELRSFHLVELRAEGDAEPTIEGTAAVYNQESDNLGGFVEIIEPGFFDGALESDIRACWNHNPDQVLGRRKNNTLTLADTQGGLQVRISPPPTQYGKDAVISIRRGDVDQMSFAFYVKENGDRWAERDDGVFVRRLLKGGCRELLEVSPVAFPAYPQTSVQARSRLEELKQTAVPGPESRSDDPTSAGKQHLANLRRRLELAERE